MIMTLTQRSLLMSGLAVVLTTAGLFWHRRARFHEAVQLRQENIRLQQEIETRVRDAQAPASGSSSKIETATRSIATGPHAQKADADYRDEGNATPQATLQSFAYACDQGDVSAVMRLIQFDPDARIRAQAFLAAMPEAARKQWASPEAMAATLLVNAGMRSPFPHTDVLDTATVEPISEQRVKLHLAGTHRADSEYQLTSEGWKYAITTDRVEAYITQSKRH